MSWTTVKLGEVITHRKEFITISDTVEYKRCRVQVNRKGVVLRDSVKGIQINTKKQQVCKEGDFLVAEIDAKVGGYGFVPADLDGAIVSSHYFLFEVDETKMLKSYLAWIIKTDIIQEQISSKGSTNYAAIRPSHVLNFQIPLPSLAEQNELIKKLDAFYQEYEMIQAELQKQENYLTLLRQSILQEAVQGKLVPQDANDEPAEQILRRIKSEKTQLIKAGKLKKEKELPPITEEEIPFELPKGWVWCRLGEILNVKSSKRIFANDYTKEGVPFYRSMEIGELGKGKNISTELFIERKKYEEIKKNFGIPKEGDILIACIGGSIGNTWVVDTREFYYKDGNLVQIESIPEVTTSYLLSFLKSDLFLGSAMDRVLGSAYNALTIIKIKSSLFPLPPLFEQLRIVEKIEQLKVLLTDLEKQIQNNKAQTSQLLPAVLLEAFTGEQKVYAENDMLTMAAEE